MWKNRAWCLSRLRRKIKRYFVAISLTFAFCAPGFAQEKPLSKAEIAEARRKCKTALISQLDLQLPENWLGKDETYLHSSMVRYRIASDGTVHDVKLKRRTGAKSSMRTR